MEKHVRNFMCFMAAIFFSVGAYAQSQTVSGTVSDEGGLTLTGVTVLEKGTSNGTITDIDGKYTLSVGSNATLIFSFVGYSTQEIAVNARSSVNVSMVEDVQQLSEVVVVGYGVQRKEELTGSLEIIDATKLEQIPSSSFQDALQGNAAGVQVSASDGAPGAGISVRVRGIGSISASNEPLYVIDGIPVTSGSVSQTDFSNGGRSSNVLSSLNPNDIENIVILKDAASTAIYGSRGANGVVLITTKSGQPGKAKIDLKIQTGFADFAFNNLLEGLNNEQYKQLYVEGYVNAGTRTQAEAEALYAQQFPEDANTNWLEEMTQTGRTNQYNLSMSGGTEDFTYFVSGSYFDQEGVVVNNFFDRFTSRVNLTAKATDKLTISNKLNVSFSNQRGITDGTRWQAPFYLSYLMAPAVPVYDDQGRFYGDHKSFFMGGNNPVGHLYDDKREMQQSRIIDNFDISYKILDNLTFRSAWSFDILNVDEHLYANTRYGDGRNLSGTANDAATDIMNWLGTQSLSYNTQFGESHFLDVFAAYEAQKVTTQVIEASGNGFAHPELKNLASAANPTFAWGSEAESAINSYFTRVNYDYDDTYFLHASIRRDGSSRFGPEVRWGTFWALGGGYTLSNAPFMADVDFIDFFKIKASYGEVGNSGIGNFDWAGLYSFSREYDGSPGGAPSQVANPFLTWESQDVLNIGFESRMLSDKITLGVEYFNRVASDLILNQPLSYTTGFRSVTKNVGDMANNGIEITLNTNIIETNDYYVDLGLNFTSLNNEVTYLPEPIVDGTKRREQGRDFQEYYLYGWAGVNSDNGDPLWYTDENETETTNNINEASRYYQGKSATPDFYGGLNLSGGISGFSVNVQFNYMMGHHVYDAPGWVIHGDGRFTPRSTSTWAFENRWTTPGQEALFPQHRWGGNQSSNTRNSSRYLYAGDFIRLRTLNFAYDLPASMLSNLNLRSVKVYTNFNNIWTWVKDKNLHFDPEQTISGVYNTVTPISKTISLGVNVGI